MKRMFPEAYRDTLLRLVEENEDMKTLLGLFPLLGSCTTEEALAKDFNVMTGRDVKELLNVLRRNGILKIGAHNEYLCLSGYEDIFNEIAREYMPQPGDLVAYVENAIKEDEIAALEMMDLLLNIGEHGISGFTQYQLLRTDMSEQFSPAVFRSLEEDLLRKRFCVYGKKHDTEFLRLYLQSDDTIQDVKKRILEWKSNKLTAMPTKGTVEQIVEELVRATRRKLNEYGAEIAAMAGMSEGELKEARGYFSGFEMDETFHVLTSYLRLDHDGLHIVLTDSISRYDAWEWKDYPVLIITEKLPRWIRDFKTVFKDAYPKLSDRKIAIAVPNMDAYSNFKQTLLSKLITQLGISEPSEFLE
jgi:hypothetical protein